MSKKVFSICLSVLMMLSVAVMFCGCGKKDVTDPVQGNTVTENTTEATTVPFSPAADSVEALETLIMNDVKTTISELEAEYDSMISGITNYEEYLKNVAKIEDFYGKVSNTSYQLSVKLRQYSVSYAELVINSGKSFNEICDDLDGIYDCIYDDAGDELYDGIYDGILDDMYEDFYSGVIDDAIDDYPYKEWSKVSSDAYDIWSDTSSDCYDHWSDMCSDVYDFRSALIGDIYDEDMEEAKETIADFKADIQRLSGTPSGEATNAPVKATVGNTAENKTAALVDGMRPDFKAAMDSYEAFMNEYVDFMKKYNNNPSDAELLSDYADYVSKYSDFVEDFDKWEDEEMNNTEAAYYIDVQARVSKKLLEIS